jgi:cellulose biosynthesis protein BcsQ
MVALRLAAAFWQRGENVLVLDLDPQASAAEWQDARAERLPYVESGLSRWAFLLVKGTEPAVVPQFET